MQSLKSGLYIYVIGRYETINNVYILKIILQVKKNGFSLQNRFKNQIYMVVLTENYNIVSLRTAKLNFIIQKEPQFYVYDFDVLTCLELNRSKNMMK